MRGRRHVGQRGAAAAPIELLTSASERLRGLLFRRPDGVTRLLLPCNDVHTFGMRHPIDIAFADDRGRVLEVHRCVGARRRRRCRQAAMTAERFSRAEPWLEVGDVIGLEAPHAGAAGEAMVMAGRPAPQEEGEGL